VQKNILGVTPLSGDDDEAMEWIQIPALAKLIGMDKPLELWFSIGVPQNPWMSRKANVVPPISKLECHLEVFCTRGAIKLLKS